MLQWLPGAGQSLSPRINSAEHDPNLQLTVMLERAEQLTALTCFITLTKLEVMDVNDSLHLMRDESSPCDHIKSD